MESKLSIYQKQLLINLYEDVEDLIGLYNKSSDKSFKQLIINKLKKYRKKIHTIKGL